MDAGREGVWGEDRLSAEPGPARPGGLPGRIAAVSRSVPLTLVAFAIWLGFSAGLRPLLNPDEGRYASVAFEMLHGDWLVPTLNGLPFFHKPPLMYWIDIVAMQLFGVTAFAVRFAALLGAWLMGAALLLALRRWSDARSATLALVVLATSSCFFVGAQYANHDMLVAGLITVAVFAFVRALDDAPKPLLRWVVAGWVACALALLAKGLIGVVLPALVLAPWLVAQRRGRELLHLLHPLGLVAFVVVAGPWLVAMQLRYPGFFDYFIVEQHFRRYAGSTFNNAYPFWFFIVVLPLLMLPWSGWLARGAADLWRGRGPFTALLIWWVVAIVAFFSLPSSKLVDYVWPALAPWSALTAFALLASATRPRTIGIVIALAALLCVGTVIGVAWVAPGSHRAAAEALAARLAPGDRVAMVDGYLFDVPFYARLRAPVRVASNWADPDLPKHDNWRKELFDAGRFDPAKARTILWPISRLDALGCGASAVWFVIRPGERARIDHLAGIRPVYADARTELWRAPGRSDCSAQ